MFKNKKHILMIVLMAGLMALVFADIAMAQSVLNDLNTVGDSTELPNFESNQHGKAPIQSGVAEAGSAALYLIDMLKWVLGTLAFLMIILAVVRMITAGKEVEDVLTKQKENIKYIIGALIIVLFADILVRDIFFGYQGEVFNSETSAKEFATKGTNQFMGFFKMVQLFIGGVAVLSIIGSGFSIMAGGVNEETRTNNIKRILYAIGGLILIGISELVVKGILFPNRGDTLPDTEAARLTIQSLTNFATGFIAFISIAVAIYGGFLYIMGAANEENTQKAKKVLIGALIGILVALGSFAIVRTLLPDVPDNITQEQRDNLPDQPEPGELF